MTDAQQRLAAKTFATYWKGRGYEKGESQAFWLSLLHDVYGVEHPEQFIIFEDQVHLDHTSFIDGIIPSTKVLIEQKGFGKDLNKPIKQSDGTLLTPFQQAKRYITELPLSQHPRWVITCNFAEFNVYDMERPGGEPENILVENLEKEYYRLQFLVNTGEEHLKREMEVSIAAGEIVGMLYNALAKQYADPESERAMKSLNVLCVRLVFCLYSEDAGIFGHRGMFHDYLAEFETRKIRRALLDLFCILNTPLENRDPYLIDDNPLLAAFPYVNGGLFADEDIEIPPFTDEIKDLILINASENFNWEDISPTIFGAVFESTLNPETRRSGGMHYTSIDNIHKVIDPLFLDDLKSEFVKIKEIPIARTREKKLIQFQEKLASLRFLDPACGSGNFLTETYLSLRRLENKAIAERYNNQMAWGETKNPIKVSIQQFYGIEINDFAVTVAKAALWIAESQMFKETTSILYSLNDDFLPLKTNAHIVEGNALRMEWESVVPKEELSYIMGNPPFVGYSLQSNTQKKDILSIYVDEKGVQYKAAGKIDYVAGWYFKTSQYMKGTSVRAALVSTNSITQGEQVPGVWKPLYDRFGIHIDFAHRTFRWDNEATTKAHVHCVIIGFSVANNAKKRLLYISERFQIVDNINPYLIAAPVIFINSRSEPICSVPSMRSGGKPVEGGNLIFTSEEKQIFVEKEPASEQYFRPFMGSDDFINGRCRWCLWLPDISMKELREMPLVERRIEAVRNFRLASAKAATREYANYPTRFMEIKQPESNYLLIPATSSENRRYIPMGYLDKNVIASNATSFVPNATLYHFGVLTSNVHMAWVRAIAGRLKSDYRYSVNIVYNNFPWPTPTNAQKAKIEQTAQEILDARNSYSGYCLADMYGEKMYLFPKLLKAHQKNDRAVMEAYGFDIKTTTETTCVEELMKRYQKITENK